MQGSKLYVGNLTYSVTNEQLQELFAEYGEVKHVNIIEGKGFGFVEMGTPEEAQRAKDELNGTEFSGRTMRIDEARPPKSGPRNSGDGFRRY
jgi:RNA recognition motif-containing protein